MIIYSQNKHIYYCVHSSFRVGDANPDLFKDDTVVDVSDPKLHVMQIHFQIHYRIMQISLM